MFMHHINFIEELDVELTAQLFTKLIQENLVDPDLKRWILPKLSTTATNDISVAAKVMMQLQRNIVLILLQSAADSQALHFLARETRLGKHS